MGELEAVSSADRSTPKMQGFYHLSKRKVGSQSELGYFVEELRSWSEERQESQRRLDNLLSSYSRSIKKGINSLIEEVGDLQANNSVITKERNDLLVTVNKMSGEIEHLRARFPIDKLFPNDKENYNHEVEDQDTDSLIVELTHAGEDEGEREEKDSFQIAFENHDEKRFGDDVDQTMPQEETYQVNAQLENVESIDHVVGEELVTKDQFDATDHEQRGTVLKNKRSKPYKSQQSNTKNLKNHKNPVSEKGQGSPKSNFDQSTNKPLRISAIHSKRQNNVEIEKSRVSRQKSNPSRKSETVAMHDGERIKGGFGKTLMCDQCPYKTSHKGNFLQHMQVHNDTRNYLCKECPYKSKTKDTLKDHIKSVHENIRDLVCDECGYTTSRPCTLSEHKQTVHNRGEKEFSCDQCPYRAYMKKILVKHVRNVHLGREYKLHCEQCDFKSNRHSNLTTHTLQVHK